MITVARVTKRMESIIIILHEYRSICEAGFLPSLVIFTFTTMTSDLIHYLQAKLYCYRTQSYIPIQYNTYNSSLKYQLADQHRIFLQQDNSSITNLYDIFIYQEDDMIFTLSHLQAYLIETYKLEWLLSNATSSTPTPSNDYSFGFFRYINGYNKVESFRERSHRQNEFIQKF